MKRAPRSGIQGFTLLEMLIATALMGVVLAALATVTAQWLPNWNRGFTRVQSAELVALGLERVVADISAAEFVTPNRATKNPLFEGFTLGVTFVRTAIGPNARPGLEIVRIAETADQRGRILVRTAAPFVPTEPGTRGTEYTRFAGPVVLMRPPYRLVFSYAGQDRVWRDDWLDVDRLPSAIRVRVRNVATEETLATSTATTIHADLSVGCVGERSDQKLDCGDAKQAAGNANSTQPAAAAPIAPNQRLSQ